MLKQNALHGLTAFLILASLGGGLYFAAQSPLFKLEEVVIEPLTQGYPLTTEQVMELANVPLGRWNLFSVELAPIEARIKKNVWVRGVVLSKEFPHTLKLKVIERKPVAMLNETSGKIYYLEDDGTGFEDRQTLYSKDLPILNGFPRDPNKIKEVVQWIQAWFYSRRLMQLELSSVNYDEKTGLKALVVHQNKTKIILELGLSLEEAEKLPQSHLNQVLEYLTQKSLQASKIWLGDGKKIIVKLAGGS